MKSRFSKTLTTLAAITTAGALVCASAAAEIEETDVPGIRQYSQLDGPAGFAGAPVGFGGATQAAAMPWLRREGYAAVINLRLATEKGAEVDASRTAAQASGLKYVHLPFDPKAQDPQIIDKFLAAVGDQQNQPVYIHCNSATRVAALWMIARVLEDGWEVDRARKEARAIAFKPDEAVAFATRYLSTHGDKVID